VTLLLEDELGALSETGFDLDLLNSGLNFDCLGVMLNHAPIILNLFNGAIVEFTKSALDIDDDVLGLGRTFLCQATKAV